jgi:carboxypeptidase D
MLLTKAGAAVLMACRQLLPALAEWLCANYKTDPVAKRVVTDLHLFLLPSMNPDGYALRSRLNA